MGCCKNFKARYCRASTICKKILVIQNIKCFIILLFKIFLLMLFTTTCFQSPITYFYFQLKNFKCGDCGYTCYLKTDLERHIMNVHDKFRSPCPSCGKKYSDLRQHIRVVHEGAKVMIHHHRSLD